MAGNLGYPAANDRERTINPDASINDVSRSRAAMQPTGMEKSATYLRRAATTALLALSLLAPFGAALFLQEASESCDMNCCRTSHCCCHRMDSSDMHGGPAWSAAPACGSDCARRTGFPGSPSITLGATWIRVGFAPETESLLNSSKSEKPHNGTEFALFERPPPPTCS